VSNAYHRLSGCRLSGASPLLAHIAGDSFFTARVTAVSIHSDLWLFTRSECNAAYFSAVLLQGYGRAHGFVSVNFSGIIAMYRGTVTLQQDNNPALADGCLVLPL